MIYACAEPYVTNDGPRFNLWADQPLEAEIALFALGVLEPQDQRRRDLNGWEAYAVTRDQLELLPALGVTITDKWGPVLWLAHRDGRQALIDKIAALRAQGDDWRERRQLA